jgi:hypothetical protein
MRKKKEVQAAEQELFTRVWYGRTKTPEQLRENGTPEDIIQGMLRASKAAEEKYGKESLHANIQDDWSWGFLSGKLAALRWVLGWENFNGDGDGINEAQELDT